MRAPEIVKYDVPVLDPRDRTTRHEKWADTAFQGILQDLQQAPEGGKHQVLVRAASRAGSIAAHGLIDAAWAKAEMFNAIAGRVKSAGGTRKTIEDMFALGLKEPCKLP